MPFQKGQSGNPGGRAQRVTSDGRTLKQICRDHTDKAIAVLVEVLESGSENAKMTAAKEMLDRGWGRATQPISGDDDAPPVSHTMDFGKLSTEALREIAQLG